jgi:hypothetical protein
MQPNRRSTFDLSHFNSVTRPILTLAVAALTFIAVAFITAPAASAQSGTAPETRTTTPATIVLTKNDVERFVAAIAELGDLGLRLSESGGMDATGVMQMTESIANREEAIGILDEHGFDVPEFQEVGYSVMLAYAAGEMENADVDIAAARDQFASLQGMIPEEQYQMLDQQIGNMQQAMESQPEANIELVRGYKSRIEAATN